MRTMNLKQLPKPIKIVGALVAGFVVTGGAVAGIAVAADHLATSDAARAYAPSPSPDPSPSYAPAAPPAHQGWEKAYKDLLLQADAKTLGISVKVLKSDFGQGMTLQQIAASKSMTEATFRSALIPNLTPMLDRAVADQQLTGEQEQMLLARLQARPIPYWSQAPQGKTAPASSATPSPGA
jgi:hypothetical protein